MNNFKTVCILLSGLLFLIPYLIPLVIALYFFFEANKNKQNQLNYFDLKNILLSLIFFIPLYLSINYLSAKILDEYNLQSSVLILQQKNFVSLASLIHLVVLSPLLEEYYFRGLLLKHTQFFIGPFWATILSSFYFSCIHLNILAFPTLFVLGIFFGLISILTKSIITSIIMHSIFNTIMVFMII